MQLILIRHGDAGAYALPDDARQLSSLGIGQAQTTGKTLAAYLTTQNLVPVQCISSSYIRAKQTARQILAQLEAACSFALPTLSICPDIIPNGNAAVGLKALFAQIDAHSQADESAASLVVCHMAIIAQMAALLTNEPPEPFALAQARAFELVGPGVGMAEEVWRFTP